MDILEDISFFLCFTCDIISAKNRQEEPQMSNAVYDKLLRCYECFQEKIDFKPEVAVVLGSGLGNFARTVEVVSELPYSDIEGFPVSTVPGHAGKFIFGYIEKVSVVLMQGRVHYYEGYQISDVVLPARLMKLMGAKILFLTNAAGGINPAFHAGSLMMITDHISSFAPNPLIGSNIDELGTRFPDMTHVYDEDLQEILRNTAKQNDIELFEGIYAQMTGPSFESPAEIKMLQMLGASAVGMSTVVEAIAANHMGMKICGVSCISNLAAGMNTAPLTHEEVQEAANAVAPKFEKLLCESVAAFGTILK